MKTYIIYHENFPGVPCADGFVSAWVAKKKYPTAILKGARYQDDTSYPDYLEPGDKALIVDFSFPQDVIEGLVYDDIDVVIIDHHEGAWEMLNSLEHQLFKFNYDINQSGASLTWLKLFPNETMPVFIKFIQANDTRNKFYFDNYDAVKSLTGFMFDNKHSFQLYEMLAHMSEEEIISDIITPGMKKWGERKQRILDLFPSITFEQFEEFPSIPRIRLKSKDYSLRSDVCEIFLMQNLDYPFMVASDRKDQWFSLRSYKYSPNETDVKSICKRFGGGGHRHASGFTSPGVKPKKK
jgi:oligoribonuclease NrnB/cAMP/cGMP phosphodiesterase (DHH superfamily)